MARVGDAQSALESARQKRIFILTSSQAVCPSEAIAQLNGARQQHEAARESFRTSEYEEVKELEEDNSSFSRSSPICCHSSSQRLWQQAGDGPTQIRRVERRGGSRGAGHINLLTAIMPASLLVLASLFALTLAAGQPQQPVPTVIVRGFLNYRTTVDGTVLLFTPDAGGGQQASSTLAAIQPTQSAAPVQPSSAATFYMNNGGDPASSQVSAVEPTSVLLATPRSSTTTPSELGGETSNDEWHPIQATPPLKSQQSLGGDSPRAPEAPPSVQADDLEAQNPKQQQPAESTTSASTTSRPKRPSHSFSGAAALSHHRSRTSSSENSASGSSSINGIRRPGLTTPAPAPTTTGAVNPIELSSANAANAFQSRLASANTRLRNRQRHRHPFASTNNPHHHQNHSTGSIPESGNALDVASSIEAPIQSSVAQPQPAASLPVVGSDEIQPLGQELGASSRPEVVMNGGSGSPAEAEIGLLEPINEDQAAGLSPLSRAGELRPSSMAAFRGGNQQLQRGGNLESSEPTSDESQPRPKLLSGGLQQGALSSGSMSFDALFQNDQPQQQVNEQQQQAGGLTRPNGSALSRAKANNLSGRHQHANNNEKLSGWLGQHHNKFVPRPANVAKPAHGTGNDLSHQLAANLNQLAPPSQAQTAIQPTSALQPSVALISNQTLALQALPIDKQQLNASESTANSTLAIISTGGNSTTGLEDQEISQSSTASVSMQTITKTYSTIIETSKTRLVPLQVKSSTAVFTITEDYVMTKLMTAYQTMPAGEFILPELSTRSPFDVFTDQETKLASESSAATPQAAPSVGGGSPPANDVTQEQPISLDTSSSPKSANNWLHDFSANNGQDSQLGNPSDPFQQQNVLALLEQQAREANLANFQGADLEQLASQLDPASLLADGTIQIPDLNNPLVLAAAIQNPQLAAVILAAQQLRLKQRNGQANNALAGLKPNQQQQPQLVQLQPSYSTSFSTLVKPSTYTSRDTMYTTRLVSFRDGRTVRTRTVSEPGPVIEQVLTTTITETIPITMTIRPTGVLSLPSLAATSLPNASSLTGQQSSSNQATINNALFATQLANILARRQQQLQTSFNNPALMSNFGSNNNNNNLASAATPQQLLALQQLFNQQKRQPTATTNTNNQQQQQQQQFQPNLQQLLQSMGQSSGNQTLSSSNNQPAIIANGNQEQQQVSNQQQQQQSQQQQQTPPLPQTPRMPMILSGGPITTTLTSLQVRTYTVHNAFKTIFRTITSTVLTPTVLPSG